MSVKTFLVALFRMAAGMGDYFPSGSGVGSVTWRLMSGQDREGPLLVEGRLLAGHAVSRSRGQQVRK
jgi:hypothetical protein